MTLVRIAPSVVLACALLVPSAAQESTADKVPARLTAERVAALPAAQRPAWTAYLESSDATRAADRAALDRELRTSGRTQLTRAPLGPSMDPWLDKADSWYASEDARRIADAVISYQAPSGGWSKRLDFAPAAGSRGRATAPRAMVVRGNLRQRRHRQPDAVPVACLRRRGQDHGAGCIRTRPGVRPARPVPQWLLAAELSAGWQLSRRRDLQR